MITGINSGFSAQDLSQMWQKLTKKADTNGDGTISKSELASVLSKSGNTDSSSLTDLLNVLDGNGDGSITQSEFTSGVQQLTQTSQQPPPPPPSLSEDDMKSLFQKADTNGDGKVSKDELKAAMPKDGNGNGPSVDDVFSSMDADGDGSVTRSEFVTAMQKHQEEMQSKFNQMGSSQTSGSYDQSGTVQNSTLSILLSALA